MKLDRPTKQLIKQMQTFKLPDGSVDPNQGKTTYLLLEDGSKVSYYDIIQSIIAGIKEGYKS